VHIGTLLASLLPAASVIATPESHSLELQSVSSWSARASTDSLREKIKKGL
jgi:hypothetical protein